jgi:hypothetical protein
MAYRHHEYGSNQGADQVKAAELRADIARLAKTAQGMPVASELASGYRHRIAELHAELTKLTSADAKTRQPAKTPEQQAASFRACAEVARAHGDIAGSASALAEAIKIEKTA